MWQDGMCTAEIGTEAQVRERGIMWTRVTYPVLRVLTVRAKPGRDGGSMRMGVRAARALTGLSLSVASGHMQSRLFSMILSRLLLNTHPYLTQAYQSPSQKWSVPWLASMVRGARALLDHSSSALQPSSSALEGSSPGHSRNHSQKSFYLNHSCFLVIATATPLYAQQQPPTTVVVHEKG